MTYHVQCAICGESFESLVPFSGAPACVLCAEDLLKARLYRFITPRLEAIADSGRTVTLRCRQCGYPYETDSSHVTIDFYRCPDCWRAEMDARAVKDAAFDRAVKKEFAKAE